MCARAVIDRGREAESEKSDTGAWSTSADRNGIARWERSGVKEKNGGQRNSPPTDTLVSRFSCYISDINTAKGMLPLPVLRSTTILPSSGGQTESARTFLLSRATWDLKGCVLGCVSPRAPRGRPRTLEAPPGSRPDSSSSRLAVPESTRARFAAATTLPRSSGSLLLSYI